MEIQTENINLKMLWGKKFSLPLHEYERTVRWSCQELFMFKKILLLIDIHSTFPINIPTDPNILK